MRDKLQIHKIAEVIAGWNFAVFDFALFALGRGPFFPRIKLFEGEEVLGPRRSASMARLF